jgi:hypothetical protein
MIVSLQAQFVNDCAAGANTESREFPNIRLHSARQPNASLGSRAIDRLEGMWIRSMAIDSGA